MGGTMRLGSYPCVLRPAAKPPPPTAELVQERHRHRWEFNNSYRDRLEGAGHGV
jgi:CTP synthase